MPGHYRKSSRDYKSSPYRRKNSSKYYDEEENDGTNLYIANLSLKVRTKDFEEYFKKFGKVVFSTQVKDPDTGLPKGYGFVKYEYPEVAAKVIKKTNGVEWIGGRKIMSRISDKPFIMPKDSESSSREGYEVKKEGKRRKKSSSSSRKPEKYKQMESSSVDSRQRKYYQQNVSKKYDYERKMSGKRPDSPKKKI